MKACDISKLVSKLGDCDHQPANTSHRAVVCRDLEPLCNQAVHDVRELVLEPLRTAAITVLATTLLPYFGSETEAQKTAVRIFDKSPSGMGNDWAHLASQLRREYSDTAETHARKVAGVPALVEAFRTKYSARLPENDS